MQIKKVSIIGLGALGVLFGHHLAQKMSEGDLRIIADESRISRYEAEGIFSNGEPCRFHYVSPQTQGDPADLLLIAVKYNGLDSAVEAAKNQVGESTVILSLLNGISSEDIIGETYGMDKLLYCVAQGMDAMKEGNRLTYSHMGLLSIGDLQKGPPSEKLMAVSDFFKKTELPHEMVPDIKRRMWGKFMLNVGLNQATAVFDCDYCRVQNQGYERGVMIAAMREVMALSETEGVSLTEEDLNYWLKILGTLDPKGRPSMWQDIAAKRRTEVELFAGTMLRLCEKHGIPCPTNRMYYEKIREIESNY